jgi:chorismate mutase/prephenate dehydratase
MALTIAYLGPEKTNTHSAAQAKFGRRGEYLHAPTVDDVFSFVERRQADYGVVPIENSLEGAVTHTLDRFIDFSDTPVHIHGEIERPIHHYLITHRAVPLGQIRAVYSHPQALAQCRAWVTKHVPFAKLRETDSTADAVWYVLHDKNRETRAAIGRAELATAHRELGAVEIQGQFANKTRFLVLGLGEPKKGRRNKTSILLALHDKPGALHDALMPFKRQGINLTKIESRPSKKKAWEYLFFIDFEGHESEPRVQRALKSLARSTSLLRVLGSYPLGRSTSA